MMRRTKAPLVKGERANEVGEGIHSPLTEYLPWRVQNPSTAASRGPPPFNKGGLSPPRQAAVPLPLTREAYLHRAGAVHLPLHKGKAFRAQAPGGGR